MKNLTRIGFMSLMMGGLLFVTSCGKDDEPVIDLSPSLIVTTTPSANSDGVIEIEIGSGMTIVVAASTPAGINAIRISDGTTTDEQTRVDLGLEATDIAATATFVIGQFDGVDGATSTITVTVVDEAGASATEELSILLIAPPSPPVKSYTAQLIYAPAADGSTASWFSTNLGSTVTESQVNDAADPSSEDVDLGYYATSTPEFGIASPSAFSRPGIDITDWTARNASMFKKVTLTNEEYIALSVGTDLQDLYSNSSDTPVGDIKFVNGDYIAFKLDDAKGSKTGVIKIVDIVDGGSNGDFFDSDDFIEIEVLVEE